jgi:hypothetical protein
MECAKFAAHWNAPKHANYMRIAMPFRDRWAWKTIVHALAASVHVLTEGTKRGRSWFFVRRNFWNTAIWTR